MFETSRMRCRHFNDVSKHEHCKAGIAYAEFSPHEAPPTPLPCFGSGDPTRCQHFDGMTQAELDAELALVLEVVKYIEEIWARKRETCICGQPIDHLEQVGRSVYARPCGCRLGQGFVPRVWEDS